MVDLDKWREAGLSLRAAKVADWYGGTPDNPEVAVVLREWMGEVDVLLNSGCGLGTLNELKAWSSSKEERSL